MDIDIEQIEQIIREYRDGNSTESQAQLAIGTQVIGSLLRDDSLQVVYATQKCELETLRSRVAELEREMERRDEVAFWGHPLSDLNK